MNSDRAYITIVSSFEKNPKWTFLSRNRGGRIGDRSPSLSATSGSRTKPTTTTIMHASLIRRSLGGLVPPKIATPRLVVRRSFP